MGRVGQGNVAVEGSVEVGTHLFTREMGSFAVGCREPSASPPAGLVGTLSWSHHTAAMMDEAARRDRALLAAQWNLATGFLSGFQAVAPISPTPSEAAERRFKAGRGCSSTQR